MEQERAPCGCRCEARRRRVSTPEEIVADPLVRAVMLADQVDPDAFKELLRSVAVRRFQFSLSDQILRRLQADVTDAP